jgi:antitoxin ParD1/3/4
MNVSLTPDLERFVREKVDSGLYNSASEVVREALRLLVARDEEEAARQAARWPANNAPRQDSPSLDEAAARLREGLGLLRLSYSLMEQNLRRRQPGASEVEIEEGLAAWKAEADWAEETPGYLERSPERLEKLRRAGA